MNTPQGKNDAVAQSGLNVMLAGPCHMLMVKANCPSCGSPPSEHHVENYDPMWRDGDVICKCGTKVRDYDAS